MVLVEQNSEPVFAAENTTQAEVLFEKGAASVDIRCWQVDVIEMHDGFPQQSGGFNLLKTIELVARAK
jgi:hypothetical protein